MAVCTVTINDSSDLNSLHQQLQAALHKTPQPASNSRYLNDLPVALRNKFTPDITTPAAVLVPIIAHPDPTLLLTVRTAHLSRHGGQVSFPGGRSEASDLTPIDCALRETFEETGITPEQVEALGYLDTYTTRTGFVVTPIVGWVQPDIKLQPEPAEVSEIFEIPLSFALDNNNYHTETAKLEGHSVSFKVLQHGDYRIWGATAAMLYYFQASLRHE